MFAAGGSAAAACLPRYSDPDDPHWSHLSPQVCLSLLELCRSPIEFSQVHAQLAKFGVDRQPYFFTRLMGYLAISPAANTAYARRLFDLDPKPNSFAYNVMIRGYAQSGQPDKSLALFRAMVYDGAAKPNCLTFPFVLKACSSLGAAEEGQQIHASVYKYGLESDLFIQNALVQLYMSCEFPSLACSLFDRISERDVVSWNTMIAGFAKLGFMKEAQVLFDKMPERNVASWNCLIDGYVKCGSLDSARELFDRSLMKNTITWNTMICGYASCGMMEEAGELFHQMPPEIKDSTTFTVLIDVYARSCKYSDILELFGKMLKLKIDPNAFALVNVLSACSHLSALEQGEWVHSHVNCHKIKLDAVLGTALVDMYAKCGKIEKALDAFNAMQERDTRAWNSIISNLGIHGIGQKALELFFKMLNTEMVPDETTFLSVLSACRHSGLIKDGKECFHLMSEAYGMTPKAEHYACMVDLLCRAGRLEKARELIEVSDIEPTVSMWGALLGASCRLGNIVMGEYAAKHLLKLDPSDSQCFVALSNLYSRVGRWEDAIKVRNKMRENEMEKLPGCSSIEVDGVVHEFQVGSGLDHISKMD